MSTKVKHCECCLAILNHSQTIKHGMCNSKPWSTKIKQGPPQLMMANNKEMWSTMLNHINHGKPNSTVVTKVNNSQPK